MRRAAILCCALALVFGLAGAVSAAEWTLEVGDSYLQRSAPDAQTLFRSYFGDTTPEVFNAADLDFGYANGLRLSLARDWGSGWGLEAAYGKNAWEAADSLAGNVFLVTDVDGANFTTVDPSLLYTSDYESAEVNLRRTFGEGPVWLVGVRRLSLTEAYTVDSIGGSVPIPVTLDTTTDNVLTGVQAGVEARLLKAGKLSVEGALKVGVFSNEASLRSEHVDTGFTDDVVTASATGTAYAGEGALHCVYPLTDRLSLRAGYECLFLKNVALATDQIDDTEFNWRGGGTAAVDREGQLFAQGVNLAVVVTF